MSYTKEEVSAIKANLKQIEEYARKNYAPRLRKDESVSVEFGEPDPRRLRYSMDKDLSFGVNYAGDVWFRAGGLTLHFNPPEWCADRSIYDSWPYATPLLLRWQQVKQKVEAALTAKENERKTLLAFSVSGDSKEARQSDFVKIESLLHRYKMEALENALRESCISVDEALQNYLLKLYSENVPFHVQQEIKRKIKEDYEKQAQPSNASIPAETGKAHKRGDCR